MLLGDMGADVIKIERPGTGDISRYWGPLHEHALSAYFMQFNRNKRSLALNLKDAKGKRIFLELVKRSDVVLENFRPGVMQKLGLSYEDVKGVNPRIVYCSISGFGQEGPYRTYAAFDVVIQGMAALLQPYFANTEEPKRMEPVYPATSFADMVTGLSTAFAILVALRHRDNKGIGQYIDMSMLDTMTSFNEYFSVHFAGGDWWITGWGPNGSFQVKDGYIMISAGTDDLFHKLCSAIGAEYLMNDPRFATYQEREKRENQKVLMPIIRRILSSTRKDEILEKLRAAEVPCGPVNTLDDLPSDPQLSLRRMILEIVHPVSNEKIKIPGFPIKSSDIPADIRLQPPLLGQHTSEILAELGYRQSEINELKGEGVI